MKRKIATKSLIGVSKDVANTIKEIARSHGIPASIVVDLILRKALKEAMQIKISLFDEKNDEKKGTD